MAAASLGKEARGQHLVGFGCIHTVQKGKGKGREDIGTTSLGRGGAQDQQQGGGMVVASEITQKRISKANAVNVHPGLTRIRTRVKPATRAGKKVVGECGCSKIYAPEWRRAIACLEKVIVRQGVVKARLAKA